MKNPNIATFENLMRKIIVTLVVAIFLGMVMIVMSDPAEVRSYNWAKTFCGGQATDISEYKYIFRGYVECKDGRVADVPL